MVTASTDKTVRLWDAKSGIEFRRFEGHTDPVICATVSPDGRYVASGATDGTARIWEVASGREKFRLLGHTFWVKSVAFSPDGRMLASASLDGTIRFWDVGRGTELNTLEMGGPLLKTIASSNAPRGVNSVVFSAEGKHLLAASENGSAWLFDVATHNVTQRYEGYSMPVTFARFSPDGKYILLGGGDNLARLWDVSLGREIRRFAGHTNGVVSVAISPDGRYLLTASYDKTARIWDIDSGLEIRRLDHAEIVTSASYSPDNRYILTTCHDQTARLWEANNGKLVRSFVGHTATFSADGRQVATAVKDGTIRLWETDTGREIRRFDIHDSNLYTVGFLPDLLHIFVTNNSKYGIWDLSRGEGSLEVGEPSFWVRILAAAISPDAQWILTGNDQNQAELWDAETGKRVQMLSGHLSPVDERSFSPNGKFALTASEDGTSRLWEVPSGRLRLTFGAFGPQSHGEQAARQTSWAAIDSDGRYDAEDPDDAVGLHWVAGTHVIELRQLKDRYYDPGLLAKILGRNSEPLRDVKSFDRVALFPDLKFAGPVAADGKLSLELKDQGGGIGQVQIFVNDKQYISLDSQQAAVRSQTGPLTVDLSAAPTLTPGEPNQVRVVVWNQDHYLSRSVEPIEWTPPGVPDPHPAELYAIVAGISSYASTDSNVQLNFPAMDATRMAHAIEVAGKRLFGSEHVHVVLLASPAEPGSLLPTKDNIRRSFEESRQTRPKDLLIVYLAGHGVTVRGMYGYPTQEATSLDLSDDVRRAKEAITNEELADWIEKIPARHQVLILDTCAAGAVEKQFGNARDVPGDQVLAAERFKDRTGFFILMGSAADAVSYEASKYNEGLLTYALLEGMRGAALRDDKFVDVNKLFQHAADTVPDLARNIGGIQQPRIITPHGGASFDIGELLGRPRSHPVGRTKAEIVRATFQSQDKIFDYLHLSMAFKQSLREASLAVTRGGKWVEAPAVFVDADDMPGAIVPFGRYTVQGNRVTVQLTLVRDEKEFATLQVEGASDDIPGLAVKLVNALFRAAQ